MMLVNMTTMLGIVLLAMLLPSDAFHIAWHAGAKVGSPTTSCTFSTPRNEVSVRVPHYRFAVVGDKEESGPNLRDKLRKATGFSLTAFRSTWRAATGISLSAIYASALAASGLWIRKVMSAVLSVFPAWVSAYGIHSVFL